MSMTAPYGALRRLANASLVAGLLFCAAAAQARTVRILVLGDSLTAGYGLPEADGFQAQMRRALSGRGYEVTFINAAVSGDTTAGGRARLEWALADGADAALVELGANDGLRGLNPAAIEANLRAILDTLAARHIPVLLSGMVAPPNYGADYAERFKSVFTGLAGRPGIIFDPFFLEGVAAVAALNQPDRIHPNAQGVARIVARLLPAMERLIAMVPQ